MGQPMGSRNDLESVVARYTGNSDVGTLLPHGLVQLQGARVVDRQQSGGAEMITYETPVQDDGPPSAAPPLADIVGQVVPPNGIPFNADNLEATVTIKKQSALK